MTHKIRIIQGSTFWAHCSCGWQAHSHFEQIIRSKVDAHKRAQLTKSEAS